MKFDLDGLDYLYATTYILDMNNAVLVFAKTTNPNTMARLHAPTCSVVTAARGNVRKFSVIDTTVEGEIADLEEREIPVKKCKCCK